MRRGRLAELRSTKSNPLAASELPGVARKASTSGKGDDKANDGTSVSPSRLNIRNNISKTSFRTGSCPELKNTPLSCLGVEAKKLLG